mmetsp:Transcript_14255/g.21267  ORF Transcript_14255/g.21267 Transcript_14255/m.21267 type:complete len:653 (-) Transcript_14255:2021-3979(-)
MSSLDMRKPPRRLSDERRVIFPSLHGAASPRDLPAQTKPAIKSKSYSTTSQEVIRSHTPPLDDNIIVHLDKIPNPLAASHISPKGPIERSNSLDDILKSLPPLSLNNNISVKPRNVQTRAPPLVTRNIFSPKLNNRGLVSPQSCPQSCDPKTFIFPQRKTFYPAATVPAFHEGPGKKLLSESHNRALALQRKPLPSILRSKGGRSSPSTVCSVASSTSDQEVIVSPTPQETKSALATQIQQLSPNMPTLASPTSIRTLSPSTRSHDSNDMLSESEVLERISNVPKMLPKSKSTLKRNQSDTVVCRNEEDESQRQRLRKLSEGSENDPNGHHQTSRNRSSSVTSREGCVSRHASFESVPNSKKIGFDPHVWIYEYNPQFSVDELWFTDEELAEFKHEAIQRVRLRSAANSSTVLPTGTGRIIEVSSGGSSNANKGAGPVRFNHPALGCDDEVDTDDVEKMIQDALSREIRSVLLVDVHEIFLALFTKSLKSLFPHISVTTARSGEEAITRIEAAQKAFPLRDGGSLHGFDIILVEERLGSLPTQRHLAGSNCPFQAAGDDSVQRRRMTSGSELIHSIVRGEQRFMASGERSRCALLIGVSARFTEDKDVLKKSGADVIWAKPPPEMNTNQRNHLLKVLMKKRGREDLKMKMFE